MVSVTANAVDSGGFKAIYRGTPEHIAKAASVIATHHPLVSQTLDEICKDAKSMMPGEKRTYLLDEIPSEFELVGLVSILTSSRSDKALFEIVASGYEMSLSCSDP